MDCEENQKGDIAAKPQSVTRDPKGKQALLEKNPHGRNRPENTEDELNCGKENTTSQEKVRVEQGGKSHRGNTN